VPPRHTNKGEKIVGGASNANINTCVKLPIILRLVNQRYHFPRASAGHRGQ
jgi:hypothetical protein